MHGQCDTEIFRDVVDLISACSWEAGYQEYANPKSADDCDWISTSAQVPSQGDCGMFRLRPEAESAAWHRKTA